MRQVRPLAEPGIGRGEDFVAAIAQQAPDPLPCPTAGPGTVTDQVGGHKPPFRLPLIPFPALRRVGPALLLADTAPSWRGRGKVDQSSLAGQAIRFPAMTGRTSR